MGRAGEIRLTDFFGPQSVLPHCGDMTMEQVVSALVRKIAAGGGLPAGTDEITRDVLAREKEGSTVIKDGLAVPHTRVEGLREPCAAIATSERGVVWSDGSGGVVHIVFLMLIPKDRPALYLQVLRAVGAALNDDAVLRTVAAMTNAADVHRFFESGKTYLPRYITAADIMSREFITLHESDTLQNCVDTFIGNRVSEVAVLDRDGDLRGIVRAGELLRVCLPEYLLWMNDLTPIANFEPFALVLENERKTWLREIMLTEFPCVTPDTPAIQVAGEMTRFGSSRCYVREGGRLVGVVELPRFLSKIFRE